MALKKKSKTLRNPWLDEDDEANSGRGFWVPTPDEIEHACELLNEEYAEWMRKSRGGEDERRFQRPPQQITVFDQREELEDGPQMCDCPYWGTEFKDC